MVTALTSVAIALFFIGVVFLVIAHYTLRIAKDIWNELGPLLEHEMLMRRIEARLMMDDAGFEIPDWLNDEDDEDNDKIIRLVPKPEDDTE